MKDFKVKHHKSTMDNYKALREGESLEEKLRRVTATKEPISSTLPMIYQERKAGVDPACDIRTDRFDIAIEAMDKVSVTERTRIAKGESAEKVDNPNAEVTYVTE